MSVRQLDKAEATVHKFVDRIEQGDSSEALWQECSDALGQVTNLEERRKLVRDLEGNGILPRLLVDCGGAIDLNGDGISEEEIDAAENDSSGAYKNQTKLAAAYAKEHFEEIDTSGDGKLSAGEMDEWKQEHPGEVHPNESAPYQENPDRPTDSVPENEEQQKRVIERREASPQEKLEAIEKLHEMGVTSITLTDRNGVTKTYEIRVEPVSPGSSRQYVHLFDSESGQIVLRGVGADGNYAQEVNSQGRKVGYGGDRFTNENQDSFVIKFDDLSHQS